MDPATKKFKESDCDVRDINVLLDVIKVNNSLKPQPHSLAIKKKYLKNHLIWEFKLGHMAG